MNYENFTIKLNDDIYNKLNRASREYDGYVTDAYYFIANANHPTEKTFENLVNLAVDAYLAYGIAKDTVSDDWAMPATRQKYNLEEVDTKVSISWNVSFDGSRDCEITNINVSDNEREKTFYESECDDKWVEDVALLNIRLIVLSEIIAKLATTNLSQDAAECLKELRDMRVDTDIKFNENKAKFMNEFVSDKLDGRDPKRCTWFINPNDKTVHINETI